MGLFIIKHPIGLMLSQTAMEWITANTLISMFFQYTCSMISLFLEVAPVTKLLTFFTTTGFLLPKTTSVAAPEPGIAIPQELTKAIDATLPKMKPPRPCRIRWWFQRFRYLESWRHFVLPPKHEFYLNSHPWNSTEVYKFWRWYLKALFFRPPGYVYMANICQSQH